MDDLESQALENIHDYLKECLDKNNYNTKGKEENNVDNISLIYMSLKKYILRLININNFIKQENFFLKKKNETLIKENNEKNILKVTNNKKGMHKIYMDKINELNNENEFIKYKFQKILREHISLARDNVHLNNSLLDRHNYILNDNFKNKSITLKNDNSDKSLNMSKFYEGENSTEDDNLNYLNMNLFSFEKKFERICKCANFLEDILNILNRSIKYDESVIFQKKVENLKIEKEELIMQNLFLKEKVLEIETFILNDPFLVEKFNFFYDSKNISFDESIKNNFKLFKNNNKHMLYLGLCSMEKKNIYLKEKLSNEKKENQIYREYIHSVNDKLKKDLTELYKLDGNKNISYNNSTEICNTNNYQNINENTFYFNFYDTKTKNNGFASNKTKNIWNLNNELSKMNDSRFSGMFKMTGNKIDYNQKRLTYAWKRIKELEEELNDLKERKKESNLKQHKEDSLLEELDDYMKNEAYYYRIKELIIKRKKQLDAILKTEANEKNNKINKFSAVNYHLERNYMNNRRLLNEYLKNRENILSLDSHCSNEKNNYNYYINNRIIYQYMEYKRMYDFYMQNKKILKKNVNNKDLNNIVNKYASYYENIDKRHNNLSMLPNGINNESMKLLQKIIESRKFLKECSNNLYNKEENENGKNLYVNKKESQFHDYILDNNNQSHKNNSKDENEKNNHKDSKMKNRNESRSYENLNDISLNENKIYESISEKDHIGKMKKYNKEYNLSNKNENSNINLKDNYNVHENSENFDSNVKYPRRHDSSLEVLKKNIRNLVKNKKVKKEKSKYEKKRIDLKLSKSLSIYKTNKNYNNTNSLENCNNISNFIEKGSQSSTKYNIQNNEFEIEPMEKKIIATKKKEEIKKSEDSVDNNNINIQCKKGLDNMHETKKENITNNDKLDIVDKIKGKKEIKNESELNTTEEIKKKVNITHKDNSYIIDNIKNKENIKSENKLDLKNVTKKDINVKNKNKLDIKSEIKKNKNDKNKNELPSKDEIKNNKTVKKKNKLDAEDEIKNNKNDKNKNKLPSKDEIKNDKNDKNKNKLPSKDEIKNNKNSSNINVIEKNDKVKYDNDDKKNKENIVKENENSSFTNNNSFDIKNNNKEKHLGKKENFDLIDNTESEYESSVQDFFDIKKYSNVKIGLFREILYSHDKNIYTFFMNLIAFSKIDLIKTYKNRLINVQINSSDMLQYVLNNYTRYNMNTEEKEKKINPKDLSENEYKLVIDYICNNDNAFSLKILYHKINFISNEDYNEFKNRLLECGIINLINLLHDEDINNYDKIFNVSFVNFCDILGISKESCTFHFNCIDNSNKKKGYIYLKSLLNYLKVEEDIKEEYHKYNFISIYKKNLIYININENFDNLYKFFKAIIKKNKNFISLNELVYFFYEDEKLKRYNFPQDDIVSLYYSIIFYVYYTNKNKILQSVNNFKDYDKNIANNSDKDDMKEKNKNKIIDPYAKVKNKNYKGDITSDSSYNYVNYNLLLCKEHFSLDDFNFVIELKDLYFYFEGYECPFSKIKRRIIEIYGSLKKAVLINKEIVNYNNEKNNSDSDDTQSKCDLDSDHFYTTDKYRYMHSEKITFYERKTSYKEEDIEINKINKINKSVFMCLMYNIGIHIDHCQSLWDNFVPFLEGDMLDYKIFNGFLNGKINIKGNETEDIIRNIKINSMESEEIHTESNGRLTNRLKGTICSQHFKNFREKNFINNLTVDEIEVVAQVLNGVHPFNYLDKNEKKEFIKKLNKKCYQKDYDLELLHEKIGQNKEQSETGNNKLPDETYLNNKITILINGILRHKKDANTFINSVNIISEDNIYNYIAHTNIAIIEIDNTFYTSEFNNLVKQKILVSQEFMKIVDDIPILKNFPYEKKYSLSMNIKRYEFEKKRVIIRQHDDPVSFYIVKEGTLNIYFNNTDKPINTISQNTFFGEIALIFNTLRTCNVIVESDTAICYCISKEYFLSILNKDIVNEFIEYFRSNYKDDVEKMIRNSAYNYERNSNNKLNNKNEKESKNEFTEHPKKNEKNISRRNNDSLSTRTLSQIKEINSSDTNTIYSKNGCLSKSFNNLIDENNKSCVNSLKSRNQYSINSANSKILSNSLSADNVSLDLDYINKKYLQSFYSDLDKILLNIFNTEQKYFTEEMEKNLMKVKVLKKILNKMEDKEEFLRNLKYEKHPKGKHIMLEGEYFEKFYFVKKGEISIQEFNQYKNIYEEISIFKENEYFGHKFILNKNKSSFIAITTTYTELYTLEASLFKKFLTPYSDILNKKKDVFKIDALSETINKEVQTKEKDTNYILNVLKFLKKVKILNKLDDDALYNAAKNFTFKFFKKGQVIIKYNDAPDFFYVIRKGIVSVKLEDKEENAENNNLYDEKKEQKKLNELNKIKSAYLYKYDYFGELSILNEQLRTAKCEAHTNCFLLAIDKESFINNFNIIFNDLLQEAEQRYTRNYSLPPWLKAMYGYDSNKCSTSLSIKIPDSGSSFSSISNVSSDEFSFEKEINEQLKNEKEKTKNKNSDILATSKTSEFSNSKSIFSESSLSSIDNDKEMNKIKEEKEKKINEIKLKELKILEKIKLKEEKKIKETYMKKKGVSETIYNRENNQDISENSSSNQINHNITTQSYSDKEKYIDKDNFDKKKLNSEESSLKKDPEDVEEKNKNIIYKDTKKKKEIENKDIEKYADVLPKKSLSILKKKVSSCNSSELDIGKLIEKLIDFINSEYNSIFHFYESIDKFNIGYIKYNDFLDYIITLNIEDRFESRENLEKLFKYLCGDKHILTLIDFYKNIYKNEEVDKYELNLRLTEIYGSSTLAFKNVALLNVEDCSCNYSNFETVCEKVGLSIANIKNIWDEINIMNEELIPLEIVLSILNGELLIEESYKAYNDKKSLLNQFVNFFQGNEDLTRMNTNLMETNFEITYEEPIIINKGHHKLYSNECSHIVKLLENNIYFKYLTLEQRKFFTTLMNRHTMKCNDIVIKQNDEEAPIICLYEGKANIISFNIFGIESVIREIENNELYGCDEVVSESPSGYEVKVSSDIAVVWILDRLSYKENLKLMLEERKKNCFHIMPVLRNVPILRYLPEEELENISYAMKVEFYQPNHTIIKANTYDDKYFIICKGLATVEKHSNSNKDKLILSTLKKADYFGELALIKNSKRSANVVLDTETILLSINDSEFNRLFNPYYEKFLNRAKANYKRMEIRNLNVSSDIVDANSNTYISSISSYKSRNKIVTIQDYDDIEKSINSSSENVKDNICFSFDQNDNNEKKENDISVIENKKKEEDEGEKNVDKKKKKNKGKERDKDKDKNKKDKKKEKNKEKDKNNVNKEKEKSKENNKNKENKK
ncbi:cyclic nucleotide-binding protein, putative [Plasmodium gallinaceum]|uniref:Rap guanine nucleotide exchange factor, putative n=1 Tax=Plasmodium gallinaceum TaxID=5849 RepID=A0A1J1GWK8_PLAGA|nr:cyclic nucleotide-binding protein, putative [Plasmodium gallinaceum]CRG95693.1 cyclic nucleotide-binding protein, putative [Plasmodium gallinaceum]